MRSFGQSFLFDAHQSGRVTSDNGHPDLKGGASMPLIFDLCGASTNEGSDECFDERPTIPTGISDFDLRGALFFQAGDVLHVFDHL